MFLDTSIELQLDRTRKDKNRPLLLTDDREEVLTELRRVRDPLYNEVADLKFFTGDSSSRKMVNKILQALQDEGYPVNG